MNRSQLSIHPSQNARCLTDLTMQPASITTTKVPNKPIFSQQQLPVAGRHSELLQAIKQSQQANKWVVLVAAPDRRVTEWLIENGVVASRLLQVHPKNEQALMSAVTQGLKSDTCSLVVGWTDLLNEEQWQALTAEAACYQTNSLLFHRPRQACASGTPWQSARSCAEMVANLLVH
jgi:cell division inhibitor SulA